MKSWICSILNPEPASVSSDVVRFHVFSLDFFHI